MKYIFIKLFYFNKDIKLKIKYSIKNINNSYNLF